MLKQWFVLGLALVFFGHTPVRAEEDHKSEKSKKEETSRPSAEKKSSTLADKISACLKTRPSAPKNSSASPDTASTLNSSPEAASGTHSAPAAADGQALFTKHCSSCHGLEDLDLSSAAEVVGVSMPKGNPSSVPAHEVAALKEFFLNRIK